MTALERMARAMMTAMDDVHPAQQPYIDNTYIDDTYIDDAILDGRFDVLKMVRAALLAIRDGSPEIFAAMESALPLWPSSHCDNRKELAQSANQPRVRAMIDAILNETPE